MNKMKNTTYNRIYNKIFHIKIYQWTRTFK